MSLGLNRNPLPQGFNLGLLIGNGLGIVVYLVLASRAWAIPE
jgi:polyferredoxin